MTLSDNITEKIFTKEFITFLSSLPKEYVDDKKVLDLSTQINTILNHEKIINCVMALTIYLSAVFEENQGGNDLIKILDFIKDMKQQKDTNQYIQ